MTESERLTDFLADSQRVTKTTVAPFRTSAYLCLIKQSIKMTRTTKVCTLGELVDSQMIVPTWLRELVRTYGRNTKVEAEQLQTSFGTFLMHAQVLVPISK